MTDPTSDPRSGAPRPGDARPASPDDGFEMLLRERMQQLADHAPTTVHSLDEIRVQHHSGRPAARREGRHRRTAGIGATIAALVGAAGFTTVALTGAGTAGAASPEEAVRRFVSATADEDIFGMIDALDPAEVPAARAAAEQGRAEAVDADLVSEGFSLDGLDGLDVAFDGLDLVTESIADGLAVVNVAAGSATWTFDPASFPLGDQIQEAFGDELVLSTDSAQLLDLVSPAMLATVERDGRWYVSVSFTLAEYARQSTDLPVPDAPLVAVGADSPEAAADEFFSNLVSLDLAGAFATAAPGEGDALLRYAPLLIDEAADDLAAWRADGFDLELSDTSYTVEGDGSRRSMVADRFTIRGSVPEAEVYGYLDPTLPTAIFAYDTAGVAVLEPGVPLPATDEGLEFDLDFVFPDGPINTTSVSPDGTIYPLPEMPVSDGPDSFEIVRADGCTTWSGQGALATFGPMDMAVSADTVTTEETTSDGVEATESEGSDETEAAAGEVSSYGEALGYEQIDDDTWRSCAPSIGAFGLFALLSTSGLAELPTLDVVEIDGRWYVSPIGTVADLALDLLSSVRTAGSLLDSQLGWFVLGTSRESLEASLLNVEVDMLTPECQVLVATDGSAVTGLASDDPDLGDVRACMGSSIYADAFFEAMDEPMTDESVIESGSATEPIEQVELPPDAVPATTNLP